MADHLPKVGARMTREAIGALLGGDRQSYLPHRNGKIVCGCFDPQLNRRAPREIDVGNGPMVLKYAQKLAASRATIPVFLKRATNHWTYAGVFRAVRFSREQNDVRAYADRRRDAVAVLFLEEADRSSEDGEWSGPETVQALEGQTFLREHRRRERSRYLVDIKKRLARRADGALLCEVCALSSADLPTDIGETCFEVHHVLPLSRLTRATITKVDDLALLCANCHRMVHSATPPLSIAVVRATIHKSVHPGIQWVTG